MNKILSVVLLAALAFPLFAQQENTQMDKAERNKMFYSLGFLLGDNLKKQFILDNEDDFKALSQGMRDSLLNKEPQVEVENYKSQIKQKYQEDAEIISQKYAVKQQAFLDEFKREKGVKTLDDGILIKLTRQGKGKSPKADSTVTVHYVGTLVDGTKFDSSKDRNEPFKTPLTSVIPCWTKAVQQMKPGASARVVCPAETAYGNRPIGQIPANSVLIFDIDLLEINL